MRPMTRIVATVSVCALCAVLPLAAQWEGYPTPGIPRLPDGKPNLAAPVPKAPDGRPDLSGIWLASRAIFDLRQAMPPGETIPLSPAGDAIFKQRQATLSKDDPSARCLPTGLPVRALLRTPFKILQGRGTTGILYESGTRFRQVLTDGRPLPREVDWPSWQGFSIGTWEGDTFVITTSGFNGKAWLDQAGFPESDAMVITERLRRRDFGHMDMEMIIDDRQMYTRPWSFTAQFVLQVDTELLEFVCEENERDSATMAK